MPKLGSRQAISPTAEVRWPVGPETADTTVSRLISSVRPFAGDGEGMEPSLAPVRPAAPDTAGTV